MTGHEHTEGGACARASQYVLVDVRVNLGRDGRADVSVRMKPGAACWSDVHEVARERLYVDGGWYPQSPEEAAEVAAMALRQAYPGLF